MESDSKGLFQSKKALVALGGLATTLIIAVLNGFGVEPSDQVLDLIEKGLNLCMTYIGGQAGVDLGVRFAQAWKAGEGGSGGDGGDASE